MFSVQEKEKYDKILEKITNDINFKKSARSIHLIKFLYQKAVEEIDVNEFILGDELFKKNYNYTNNDSKVRVYMHYLRKKLDEYYKREGRLDPIRLEIRKGQYNLSFKEIQITKDSDLIKSESRKRYLPLIYTIIFLLGILIGLVINIKEIKMFDEVFFWKGFFTKEAKNICVIGDLLVVNRAYKDKRIPSLHPEFKTKSDFITYLQNHPESGFRMEDYTLMTKMAPIGIKKLTQWFDVNNHDFSIRLDKGFEMDGLRDNNIIFIGNFRLMGNLKDIFLSNSKKFDLAKSDSRIVSINNGERKIHQTQYPNYNLQKDEFSKKGNKVSVEYAMVSYMKLENKKKALFFSSNHDIGVMATINRFTDRKWLKQFYKDYDLSSESQFNVLFEVIGLERSEVSCDLIDLEILP